MAALLPAAGLRATLSSGATYSISFVDIKDDKLSTADGHVTILVLTTAADWEKARAVGDRVPAYCLGNPNYRMITVARLFKKVIHRFCVFVFERTGELLAQWRGVPSAKQLAEVLKS